MMEAGIALMLEVVQTSETLVNSYQSTMRYNPEDCHLNTILHVATVQKTVFVVYDHRFVKASSVLICRTIACCNVGDEYCLIPRLEVGDR
jgi:hypothetical protein